jgi:hypothetical protein
MLAQRIENDDVSRRLRLRRWKKRRTAKPGQPARWRYATNIPYISKTKIIAAVGECQAQHAGLDATAQVRQETMARTDQRRGAGHGFRLFFTHGRRESGQCS